MVGKGALKGNKSGTKLKDPDVRQEAFKQYCAWIAKGKSKESFVFDHPELSVTWETMDRYISENPSEFHPIKKKQAESASLTVWEQRGEDMMLGKIDKCQPAIFQIFMRNKFGWDKEKHVAPETTKPFLERIADKWRKSDD